MMPAPKGLCRLGRSAVAAASVLWCATGCGGAEAGGEASEPGSTQLATNANDGEPDASTDAASGDATQADAVGALPVPPCEDAFTGVPCKSGWIAPGTDRLCFGTIESACRCACNEGRYLVCKAPAGLDPGRLPDAIMPEVVCE